MIGTLAQKRTHLVALAALLALVAAMFTALAPTSAQTAGISLGACIPWDAANPLNTMNYVAIGDSCSVTDLATNTATGTDPDNSDTATSSNPAVVAAPVAVTDAVADEDTTNDELTAISVGVTEVSINRDGSTPTGVVSYRITVIAMPTVIVNIADTDNTVSNLAPPPDITVTARGFTSTQLDADGEDVTVSTSGIYFDSSTTGTLSTSFTSAVGAATADTTTSNVTGRTFEVERDLVISAASNGTYKISATVAGQADDTDPTTVERKAVSGSADLNIGDPGTSPASATLALGNIESDDPTTVVDETLKESGSKPASQLINLVYSVSNSLGNPANNGDLSTVQVIAPQGVVDQTGATVIGTASPTAKGSFTVGSVNNQARTVSVRVIVTGTGGVAESETITLTFTGGAGTIALDGASGSLLNVNAADDARDQITFGFSTVDSAGNPVGNPQNLSVSVIGPDGVAVAVGTPASSGRIDWVQGDAPGSRAGSNNQITLTSNGSVPSPLATGEYTLNILSGALTTSSTFVVAAKAASIEVSLDNATPSGFGELIKATATVSDADGNPAADGTMVNFNANSAVQGSVLSRVGVSGAIATRGGVASASFAAVGSGTAVIAATADGATGVAVVSSTAGAEAAVEEEEAPAEPALSDFSRQNGLASYSGPDASASELFALLEARGASALWLWNGAEWVLYATVDGNLAPGAVDFSVVSGDVLFISGS